MPRFFVLAALSGLGLWATAAPDPFLLLAKFIVATSACGFVLSTLYVHEFMPWAWQDMVTRWKRWQGAAR